MESAAVGATVAEIAMMESLVTELMAM